jgi:hypothetical protein
VQLDPSDDGFHAAGTFPDFMETNYYNVFDQAAGVGAFFRLGNRVNEGWAELTIAVFLPDSRVGFMFGRPAITRNDRFDAGGMRFDLLEPFQRKYIHFDGELALFEDPLVLSDPKAAFAASPHVTCGAELIVNAVCEPWQPPEVRGWATGHNEQLISVRGTIEVGELHFDVHGHGIRDHSWGPRTWHKAMRQAKWLTGPLGPDLSFMGFSLQAPESDPIGSGFVWEDGKLWHCDGLEIESTYVGDLYQKTIEACLTSGERTWHVTGEVSNVLPLRHRKDGWITRIREGLTRWTVGGNVSGYGLSEYSDQRRLD